MSNLHATPLSEGEFYEDMERRLEREMLAEGQIFPWRAHNTMPDEKPDMFAQIPYEVEELHTEGELLVARGILYLTEDSCRSWSIRVRDDNFCRPTSKILQAYFAGPDSLHERMGIQKGVGLVIPAEVRL